MTDKIDIYDLAVECEMPDTANFNGTVTFNDQGIAKFANSIIQLMAKECTKDVLYHKVEGEKQKVGARTIFEIQAAILAHITY